jgi:hypothetical protein
MLSSQNSILSSSSSSCKGLKEAVIGESQKEEEAVLALCTFPAPCSCVCSKGPRTPILTGADAGQPRSVGHALAD